jgi:hypothetical protein
MTSSWSTRAPATTSQAALDVTVEADSEGDVRNARSRSRTLSPCREVELCSVPVCGDRGGHQRRWRTRPMMSRVDPSATGDRMLKAGRVVHLGCQRGFNPDRAGR